MVVTTSTLAMPPPATGSPPLDRSVVSLPPAALVASAVPLWSRARRSKLLLSLPGLVAGFRLCLFLVCDDRGAGGNEAAGKAKKDAWQQKLLKQSAREVAALREGLSAASLQLQLTYVKQ